MTTLAEERDTHLTPAEIAAEALAQFDTREAEPTIRSLASALRVKPTAIYHHYPSRAAVVEAAIELVWQEVNAEGYGMIPDPLTAAPDDVLVTAALATRRVWLRHHRLARYMSATPRASEFLSAALALLANVFERLRHSGEEAASRFHTYASLTLGSVLFAAARMESNEALGDPNIRYRSDPEIDAAAHSGEVTRASLDEVVDLSAIDPQRDERLVVEGLRRLIASFD